MNFEVSEEHKMKQQSVEIVVQGNNEQPNRTKKNKEEPGLNKSKGT